MLEIVIRVMVIMVVDIMVKFMVIIYGYNTGPVSINLYTNTSNAITEGEINTNGTIMNQTISYGVPETNDSE